MTISIWAVLVATLAAYAIGAVWYSLLFQKQWMRITGADTRSAEEMKQMQKDAGPLYVIQLVVTFLQAYVLAWLLTHVDASAMMLAGWVFLGLSLPTLVGAVMWTGTAPRMKVLQASIQLGCQLVSVFAMVLILAAWMN